MLPAYDYQCNKCNEVFETRHHMDYQGQVECPVCDGSDTKRLILQTPTVWVYWKWSLASSESTLPKYIAPAHNKFRG